jgi:hypothetical protein
LEEQEEKQTDVMVTALMGKVLEVGVENVAAMCKDEKCIACGVRVHLKNNKYSASR